MIAAYIITSMFFWFIYFFAWKIGVIDTPAWWEWPIVIFLAPFLLAANVLCGAVGSLYNHLKYTKENID